METQVNRSTEFDNLLAESRQLKGGMGAVAWAVLEMLRRGGMEEDTLIDLYSKMKSHFANPSDEECNLILKVVEQRLRDEKIDVQGRWY